VLPGTAFARPLAVTELQITHPERLRRAVDAALRVVFMVAEDSIEALFDERRRRGRPTVHEVWDGFRDFPTRCRWLRSAATRRYRRDSNGGPPRPLDEARERAEVLLAWCAPRRLEPAPGSASAGRRLRLSRVNRRRRRPFRSPQPRAQ
jgi:hypothetical protein